MPNRDDDNASDPHETTLGEQRGFGMAVPREEAYDYSGSRSRWGSFPGGDLRTPYRGFAPAGKPPKGYIRADQLILDDISERLAVTVDASEVEVKVENGVVTLTGTVADPLARNTIEQVSRHVGGVTDVQNHITLPDAPPDSSRH